jgi:hypothetical protein
VHIEIKIVGEIDFKVISKLYSYSHHYAVSSNAVSTNTVSTNAVSTNMVTTNTVSTNTGSTNAKWGKTLFVESLLQLHLPMRILRNGIFSRNQNVRNARTRCTCLGCL